MPTSVVDFGPFANSWVGDTYSVLPNIPTSNGTLSTVALTQVNVDTTGGTEFKRSYSQAWNEQKKKYIRTSDFIIQFNVAFMGADQMIDTIANGNSIAVSSQDTLSNQSNFFSLFLADANPNSGNSYFIPCCQVIVGTVTNRQKTAQTQTPLSFMYQARDTSITPLYYRGSYSYLIGKCTTFFGANRLPVNPI
jgi:hypothetical protein